MLMDLVTNKLLYLYQVQAKLFSISVTNVDIIFKELEKAALEILGKPGFAVIFYDNSSQTCKIRYNSGFSEESLKPHCTTLCASINGKLPLSPQVVSLLSGEQRYFIPLGEENKPFGAVILPYIDNESINLSDGQSEFLLSEFKKLAANSISRFMEVELINLQIAELKTLLDVWKTISSTLNLNELLRKIMAMATHVMRCETSTVYLVDEKTNELYFHIIQADEKVGSKLKEIRLPIGTGIAGWCAKENKSVIVPDTSKDPRFYRDADKKSGFVTRSMICVPMRLKDKVIGVLQVLNRIGDIPFNNHDVEILEAIANQAVSAIDNARLYENIQKMYLSTIEVLATAIDAKDPYTQGHSRRVTRYAVAIAEELDLDPTTIENVRYASLLHDVGKIGIEDKIIRKAGRLTDEEYAIIKQHPVIGEKILKPVEFLHDKIPGVKHHHEYYDGRGYPSKLKGEEIPLIARIICVADAFDAMTTDRPYRKGLTINVVMNEFKKNSGKQFDPKCVDAFIRAFEKKLYQYFDKIPETNDMILKPEERIHKHSETFEVETEKESQPYPPFIPDENKVDNKSS